MTKTDLAAKIAAQHNLTKKDAAGIVETVLGTISDGLKAGDRIALKGFGKFATKDKKARTGRNPLTGAAVEIAATRVAKFTPTKELKASVASAVGAGVP